MSETSAVFPRMTGVIVIEVNESNPNGDPDRESDPRTLPDRRGVISAVSFKRKIRDLVHEKDGAVWKALVEGDIIGSDTIRKYGILEDRSLSRADVTKYLKGDPGEDCKATNYEKFHNEFWDARVFGNTFLESSENEEKKADDKQKANLRNSTRNGVAQVANAHSICPVEIIRSTNTKKAGAQEGKDRGMAPLGDRRILHGVYVMPFFINPALAHKTHCTLADIEIFLKLIPVAYPATASRARPFVEVRHAFVGEHKSALGSFSDFDFVRCFTPKRVNGSIDEPSSNWCQYTVATQPSEDLADRVENFRDIVDLTK
ncbi:MAG: type I CRISPR-associated protein Cas7 [Capsulimonadaceae bacterium]